MFVPQYINNKSRRASAGVTMIEMAMVMLVIAGLITSFLGVKEIIRRTRLKQIATEVQSFGIAARAFEQKYDALPGDFDSASDVIKGCESGNTNFCRDGDGDGRIGGFCHFLNKNSSGEYSDCGQTGGNISPNFSHDVALETSMFWKHLILSGFITGIVDSAANPDTPRWRQSHPESALWDAGYVVSSQDGFIGGAVNINFIPNPEYIGSPASISGAPNNSRALSVVDGIYIDAKFDNAVITGDYATGSGSGAIWWYAAGESATDCRTNDSRGVSDAWGTQNLNMKNCTFKWSVF